MINLMKQHPYKSALAAGIIVGIAVGMLASANEAHGALYFTAPPLYNSPAAPIVATSTQGVILDGTSTQDFTDATPTPIGKTAAPVVIHMSAKAQRIVDLKDQIAALQNELALLEAN